MMRNMIYRSNKKIKKRKNYQKEFKSNINNKFDIRFRLCKMDIKLKQIKTKSLALSTILPKAMKILKKRWKSKNYLQKLEISKKI